MKGKSSINLLFLVALMAYCQGFTQKKIAIENDFLKVTISPLGAQLQNIKGVASEIEYLWQGNSKYWEDSAPIMFPVNVRFKEDRFSYKGTLYNMPKMGMAKLSKFGVIQHTPNLAVFELSSNASTLKNYPFHFRFQVLYQLKNNALINQYTVENTGKDTLYFALGGHPGFRLPNGDKERRKYQFTFSKKLTRLRFDIQNSLIQSTQISFLQNEDKLHLNDARVPEGGMLFIDMPARKIGIGPIEKKPIVAVDLGNFPNVNLWSPPKFPFACIEPMVGHHDFENTDIAIAQKDYLITLAPQKMKTYYFTIEINE